MVFVRNIYIRLKKAKNVDKWKRNHRKTRGRCTLWLPALVCLNIKKVLFFSLEKGGAHLLSSQNKNRKKREKEKKSRLEYGDIASYATQIQSSMGEKGAASAGPMASFGVGALCCDEHGPYCVCLSLSPFILPGLSLVMNSIIFPNNMRCTAGSERGAILDMVSTLQWLACLRQLLPLLSF